MSQIKYPENPVLLIDDEEQFLHTASFILRAQGITNIIQCSDSRNVMPMLAQKKFSVILLDLTMPHISGFDLLSKIIKNYYSIPIIIITASINIETAVKCVKAGAFDYITKPIEKSQILNSIRNALKEYKKKNVAHKKPPLCDKLKPEKQSEEQYELFSFFSWFLIDFIKIRKKLGVLSVKRKRNDSRKTRKYTPTFSGSDMALGIIAIILLDLKRFKKENPKLYSEKKLARLLGLKKFFDNSYTRKFLSEFNLSHLKQLDNINSLILMKYGDSFNSKELILDIDQISYYLDSRESQKAFIGQKEIKSTDLCYRWYICSTKNEIISIKFLDKRCNKDEEFKLLIEDIRIKLRLDRLIIRADISSLSHTILNYFVDEGIQIISAVGWDEISKNNKDIEENKLCFARYIKETDDKGVRIIEHISLADLGERVVCRNCKHRFRAVLVDIRQEKIKIKRSRKSLKYVIFHNISSLKDEISTFEAYYHKQSVIDIFEGFKNPFAGGKMPSQKLRANEAYLYFMILAYNLFSIFRKNFCQRYDKEILIKLFKDIGVSHMEEHTSAHPSA